MDLIYNHELPVARKEKEIRLKQHSKVIWMTGLSGSGKTTIGVALERELFKKGFFVQLLDGDLVRKGINSNLSFSVEDRVENIRRIAEISKLFLQSGVITINCFISPTNEIRAMARDIIGKDDFIELFINAPLEVCEQRDSKGLYARARRGEIPDFTGIGSPFEVPQHPSLEVNTKDLSVDEAVDKTLKHILPKIGWLDK